MNANKLLQLVVILFFTMNTNAQELKKSFSTNPFFNSYNTPYDLPPFDLIKNEHYKPAFLEGIKANEKEINSIANSKAKPTFKNTILALENSGELLSKVSRVFHNLNSANTNDDIQKIAKEIAPITSAHNDNINLNEKLFARVKSVWDNQKTLKLNQEDSKLLEKTYKRFVRSGANLNKTEKEKLRAINSELSSLTLKFGQNLLAETNNYELILSDKSDLKGLPSEIIEQAASSAKAKIKKEMDFYII